MHYPTFTCYDETESRQIVSDKEKNRRRNKKQNAKGRKQNSHKKKKARKKLRLSVKALITSVP